MPAIATTLSAAQHFRSLLSSEAKGFFLLRFWLGEHTTAAAMKAIHDKATALYEAALVGTICRFTPHFTFTQIDASHLRMSILSCEDARVPCRTIASVVLACRADPENFTIWLELAPEAQLPCQNGRGLTFGELRERIRAAINSMPAAKAKFFGQQLIAADMLAKNDEADYRYDFITDEAHAELVTYRDHNVYTSLNVSMH